MRPRGGHSLAAEGWALSFQGTLTLPQLFYRFFIFISSLFHFHIWIIFTAILHPYSTTTRGLSVPADTVIHHVRYEAYLAFGRVRATMHRRALRLCGA